MVFPKLAPDIYQLLSNVDQSDWTLNDRYVGDFSILLVNLKSELKVGIHLSTGVPLWLGSGIFPCFFLQLS